MKRPITYTQRYAVYTTHGEKCYLCTKPIDFASTEVDHIIPEDLLNAPQRLGEVLKLFGLPLSFDLHSFENWLPACRPCNNHKRSTLFDATPIVQIQLQRARDKAAETRKFADEVKKDNKLDRAVNLIVVRMEDGTLSKSILEPLAKHFAEFHFSHRAKEAVGTPILVSPTISVLATGYILETVRGPYGMGSGPKAENVQATARCGSCGGHHWNGARCIHCGSLDDGD
jgi:5-methylcytosine-specific restriction endonuclease McrA